jgi:glycerate dehydrogenase
VSYYRGSLEIDGMVGARFHPFDLMQKPRCVVLDGLTLTSHVPRSRTHVDEPSWDDLARVVDLSVHERTRPFERLERLAQAQLVLTNKVVIDREIIDAGPELAYIGVLATGTNVIDLEAAKRRGIVVTNVPGYATESVAAHVFGLILELDLRIADHARTVQSGGWSLAPDFTFRLGSTFELAQRTLGVVGFGNIGQRVAAIGQAFGMRVIAATRPGKKWLNAPLAAPVDFVSVDELFAEADVVTLHCPLVAETERLVDARRLSLMKPDAILINTGRGPLVDEPALAAALAEGRIRGAGLDVLSVEPPPPDHVLLQAPRCLITPHLAWATTASRQRLMQMVTSNVIAYLAGAPTNRVA